MIGETVKVVVKGGYMLLNLFALCFGLICVFYTIRYYMLFQKQDNEFIKYFDAYYMVAVLGALVMLFAFRDSLLVFNYHILNISVLLNGLLYFKTIDFRNNDGSRIDVDGEDDVK